LKKYQFIEDNIEVVKKLSEIGVSPKVLLSNYEAYKRFEKLEKELDKPKLSLYKILAKKMYGKNGSHRTMRNWITGMKKDI
jgi:hypothetical protein